MKKRLIIVGGANGVGKTTYAYQYRDESGIAYLGADEIAKELAEISTLNGGLNAGKEFFRRLESVYLVGKSIIIESTLSGVTLADKIKQFKAVGYSIEMVYVFLDDVALCKKRVKLRVSKGGHNVPENEIERRFHRSLHNFRYLYTPLADKWQIFYNGFARPVEVAFGEGTEIMVIDEEYFKVFEEVSS